MNEKEKADQLNRKKSTDSSIAETHFDEDDINSDKGCLMEVNQINIEEPKENGCLYENNTKRNRPVYQEAQTR